MMRPRVPEAHPAWTDARLALKYISKGKARGSRIGLSFRGVFQLYLGHVGKWADRLRPLVIILGIVVLAVLCVGIQNVRLDTTLDSLWTPDSGRVQHELAYVAKVSGPGHTTDTDEMLIQTPTNNAHQSILNYRALLEHLEVLQRVTSVTVDMFDLTWSLKDLCYSPNIPSFEVTFIDQIFEKIFPCVIVTPLDCFWEGAKLHGPDFPIQIPGFRGPMKWTNLNPQELLRISKSMLSQGSSNGQAHIIEILDGFMKRAGIGSGYQEKPCLNPTDPDCPATAPNRGSGTPPDVAAILARGCYGFAPRFMHWPADLIVGGQVHNKSGHLVRAGGLMSTVHLMSSAGLYDFSKGTWRLHHIEWTEEKAAAVIEAFNARFNEEVARVPLDEDRSNQFNFYSLTPAGLDKVVESSSQFSWVVGTMRAAGVMTVAVLVGMLLNGNKEDWQVRVGLLIGGILVAVAGTAAGLGAVGFLRISCNVATVQVLPFLVVSMVSQVYYTLLYSQLNLGCDAKSSLKRYGFSLILGVITAVVFCLAGLIFPIPAVQSIALQSSILFGLSSLATLVIFPAICQIVLKRRRAQSRQNLAENPRGRGYRLQPQVRNGFPNNNIIPDNSFSPKLMAGDAKPKVPSDGEDLLDSGEADNKRVKARTWIELYLLMVNWKWFSSLAFLLYVCWIVCSGVGVSRLKLGLPITDVVPSNSTEWKFLRAQEELFPIYDIKAVTKANFDYPSNQKVLHKFHEAMSGLPWIIGDDNGGKPLMWLTVFRQWLIRLQGIFDQEWKSGYLNKEHWTVNASADGILAWKLVVQTGHVEHPVDVTQLPGNRLVDNDGVINSRAFYVYLTAWAWNDNLAYGSTAANLLPVPRQWTHVPDEKDLKIPKSSPIKYAEISYTLKTSGDDKNGGADLESQVLSFVKEIRAICSTFESRGLPVFPMGRQFQFYEQYLAFPRNSTLASCLTIGLTAVIICCSLGFSFRSVGLVTVLSGVTISQIFGSIGWLGVRLNALPMEIGLLGVSFILVASIQVLVAFCCVAGSIEMRRAEAFRLVGPPCVQSLVLLSLTALILYSPEFTFIFTHFTLLISLAALIALLNFLLLLPLLLSIFQPACWLIGTATEDPSLLLPLTPSPLLRRGHGKASGNGRNSSRSRQNSSSSRNRDCGNQPPPYSLRGSSGRASGGGSHHKTCSHNRAPSEHSLSTITEEPTSCATRRSTEIVVQPQVVVETFGNNGHGPSTKTKVSAKLKVEVHSTSSCGSSNPHSSANSHMSETSGVSGSTSSSGNFTSSSASSSTSSFNEKCGADD